MLTELLARAGANNITFIAGEVNEVEGTIRRTNAPSTVVLKNIPLDWQPQDALSTDHSGTRMLSRYRPDYAPRTAAVRVGQFNKGREMVRNGSATFVEMDFAVDGSTVRPAHHRDGAHAHSRYIAGRYDSSSASYNDYNSRESVYYSPGDGHDNGYPDWREYGRRHAATGPHHQSYTSRKGGAAREERRRHSGSPYGLAYAARPRTNACVNKGPKSMVKSLVRAPRSRSTGSNLKEINRTTVHFPTPDGFWR